MSSSRVVYTAQVQSIINHTEAIRELIFTLEASSSFKFRAGQFLMLHLPSPEGKKDLLRAYSLASGERETSQFRLLIKFIPLGLASEYFWKLNPGDTIRFTGPFGKLFFPEQPKKRLFFLSTGSGLAPHLSYLESFVAHYPQSQFDFLIGVRTKSEFILQDYLQQRKLLHPNFNFQFVLSRPDESWAGRCGYLQHQIETLEINPADSQFFICGNEEMAKSTKACLLENGISTDQIFVEIF